MTVLQASAMNPQGLLSLARVRAWCLRNGWSRGSFRALYREAHLICIARLVHYVFLEHLCDERIAIEGRTLYLGIDGKLEIHLSGDTPHIYLELTENPCWVETGGRQDVPSSAAFLRALRKSLRATPYADDFPALAHDYRNSFSNLILNLALGSRLSAPCSAIEPVYRGHGYYPFPALRIGPSIEQVVEASHLSPAPAPLFFVNVPGYRFHSSDYADPDACAAHWAGGALAGQGCMVPVHPWQLRLSPVIRDMLKRDLIALSPVQLQIVPLASQRTCRVLASGYDIKLSLDATLTGERRLLYRLNSHNAPFVSRVLRHVHQLSELEEIDFQYDVASLCWDDSLVSQHLSAIVRAPCFAGEGEEVVPVLNLWASARQARSYLRLGDRQEALATFDQYARVVMSGVLLLCAQWGISLEPHMQNTYIVLRDGRPVRAILRDLDNSILDPDSIRPLCQEQCIPLAPDTWAHMPAVPIGQRRLVHALLHGHLYPVMHFLIKHMALDYRELDSCLNDNWQRVSGQAHSASGRRKVQELWALVGLTKHSLSMRLKQSASMSF
ncbi:IucA/IucC family protein [Pseudomonas idahonensis]|uniref:IucA/IucC family protein n=1 Tax=Pseudomonas idahonensis TaxID=2942628 RepID=UPI0035C1C1CA